MAKSYMASLGSFRFAVDTAAFQQLQRTTEYRWQSQDRIGAEPIQQFIGAQNEKITLNGIIYPHFAGGLGQIDALRALASAGKPLPLAYTDTGVAQSIGKWVIKSIGETRTIFNPQGAPLRIEFTIGLESYPDESVLALLSFTPKTTATKKQRTKSTPKKASNPARKPLAPNFEAIRNNGQAGLKSVGKAEANQDIPTLYQQNCEKIIAVSKQTTPVAKQQDTVVAARNCSILAKEASDLRTTINSVNYPGVMAQIKSKLDEITRISQSAITKGLT